MTGVGSQAPEQPQISDAGRDLVMSLSDANRVPPLSQTDGVWGIFNHAARLVPGHLLLVYLARNACFQLDPESGRSEYLFRLGRENDPFLWRALAGTDGRVYCTLSGGKDLATPHHEAYVGAQGWIVSVDFRLGDIRVVAPGGDFVDPCGFVFLDDGHLLVTDFHGFGGPGGSVSRVDLASSEVTVLVSGGLLKDPVSAVMAADGALWIANAMMEGYEKENGGEIIRVDADGQQTVVVPQEAHPTGTYVGICTSPVQGEFLVVKNDMPLMEHSALLRLDTATGALHPFDLGDAALPRCYSTHIGVSGSTVWIAESYQRQLIGYDMSQDRVVKRFSLSGILGDYLGLASTFEGIESVSVVPALS
jgi:hypothetical protein